MAYVVHYVTMSTDQIVVDGQPLDISMEYTPGDRLIEAEVGGETLSVQIAPIRAGFRLTVRGASHQVRLLPPPLARHAPHLIEKVHPDLSKYLLCPAERYTVVKGKRVLVRFAPRG